MKLKKFEIDYYKKENGRCPYMEFYSSLNKKMKAKLMGLMLLLEENGNELREPYSKFLEEGIFEIRVKQGSDITRVLYFFIVGKKIIVTHGFTKKTNKTPKNEINLAKKIRKDYLERRENDE